jgi:hypothetical protein
MIMDLTHTEFMKLIDNEVNDYLKKKINKRKKDTDLNEDDSDKENLYPGMKEFKKLGRGILQEDGDTISMDEWKDLKNRVKGIFRLMPIEQRREQLRSLVGEFGLMYFKDFLQIQDRMIDSSKGKLDDPKKKQAG